MVLKNEKPIDPVEDDDVVDDEAIEVDVPEESPSRYSLLTYNIFCLPAVARFFVAPIGFYGDKQRGEWIGNYLVNGNYSFVCLQEAFRQVPREAIAKKLREMNYKVIEKFNDAWFGANAGLFFASKYPIVDQDFHQFTTASKMTSDQFAKKGCGYALVDVRENSQYHDTTHVAVFMSHLQAQNEGASVRKQQFLEIAMFIQKKISDPRFPKKTCLFMAGDLNVDSLAKQADYHDMLERLGNPEDLVETIGTDEHKKAVSCASGQRLDYILSYKASKPRLPAIKDGATITVHERFSYGKEFASDHNAVALHFELR